MGAPWTTSTKTITSVNRTPQPNALVPVSVGFAAPALPGSLSFGPAALFGAMAKMQALTHTSVALVAALQSGFTALAEVVVDDNGAAFDLVPEFDELEQTVRGALIGILGKGVCHLAMTNLGYAWSAHADRMVTARGKLADFVYDGGAAKGHGVVLVEAKGEIRLKTDAASVGGTAEDGYRKQVDRYIGDTTTAGVVIHGYCVSFGARTAPARASAAPPHAFLHVAEAAPMTAAATSSSGGGGPTDLSVASSGPPAGPAVVKLENYRAVFMLAGAPVVVAAIDALSGGSSPKSDEQTFVCLHIGGLELLLARLDEGDPSASAYRMLRDGSRFAFAVEMRVARRFLSQLTELVLKKRHEFELLVRQPQLLPETPERPVLFPDGLAVISRPLPQGGSLLTWSPYRGFI